MNELAQMLSDLDKARHIPYGITIGRDGYVDAFGGTPYAHRYDGMAGRVKLLKALESVTEHAWQIVHKAAGRVRKESERSYAKSDWVVLYWHGSSLLPLTCRDSFEIRGFASHRGAAIVAGRKFPRARVVPASEVLAERIGKIHEEVRAAVRTMLAARPIYDLLLAEGYTDQSPDGCITAGFDGDRIHLTGLRWLAGADREDKPATVEAAKAFAAGANAEVML